MNVEDKFVLMSAGGNKAKSLCHKGAVTCASFDMHTQTPITGGYVCMYVCMYVYGYVCHKGAVTCASFDMHTQTPITGGYVCMYVCIYVCMYG